MFDLTLSQDLGMIQDVVRRFANEVLAEHYRDDESEKCLPEATLKDYSALGLAGLEISEHPAGATLGAVAKTLVLEELVEKLFRDVKAMDIVEGTSQIQRIAMARKLVDLPNS